MATLGASRCAPAARAPAGPPPSALASRGVAGRPGASPGRVAGSAAFGSAAVSAVRFASSTRSPARPCGSARAWSARGFRACRSSVAARASPLSPLSSSSVSIKDVLERLACGVDLSEDESRDALLALVGEAEAAEAAEAAERAGVAGGASGPAALSTPSPSVARMSSASRLASFLSLLRAKGESPSELAGLALAMRSLATPLPSWPGEGGSCAGGSGGSSAPLPPPLDIVGTGGDGSNSVNISTGAAVLAAAAGARVAKHGNRSASSQCGSADVVEALGVPLDLTPAEAAEVLARCGVTFLFAPTYHPAMRLVAPVRRAMGLRTAFNLLGPLLNPAGRTRAVVGLFSPAVAPLVAGALRRLGVDRALVVHSGGLDELTPAKAAHVVEVGPHGEAEAQNGPPSPSSRGGETGDGSPSSPSSRGGETGDGSPSSPSSCSYEVDPLSLGIPRCELSALAGGEPATNAAILREAFAGAPGPVADALALNAGAGLYVAGLAPSLRAGVQLAQTTLKAGEAQRKLDEWIAVANEVRNRRR